MSRVLVAYATKYGSTEEIAHQIASELQQAGIEAEAIPAKDVGPIDSCSAVIVGAALYNHKWHRDAVHFLSRNSKELAASSVAVFAVGPVNDDPEEFRSAREQIDEVLSKWDWLSPVAVTVFGGRFDPARLKFPGAARMLAKVPVNDAMDPSAVKEWAQSLPEALALEQPVGA